LQGKHIRFWMINARLIAASPELLSSLQEIFELIDNGMLVRNTSGDTNPNWAIRQLPLINALYKAKQAIAKAEGK
jgi:hypothetical protein